MLSRHRFARLRGPAVLLLTVVFATSWSYSDTASSDPPSIREAQLRFVKNYVTAIRSKDAQKVLQTFHPAYRACVIPASQSFVDFVISRRMHDLPSTDYKVTSIKPADPRQTFGAAFLPAEGFAYPVKPTYVIQVDFESTKDGTSSYSLMLEVAPDHGSWYWIGACPNAKGLEFIQQRIQAGERQKAETRKRVSELKEPLLSELKQLLQAHDRVGAINKYSKETGTDLTTAVQVVDELEAADNH